MNAIDRLEKKNYTLYFVKSLTDKTKKTKVWLLRKNDAYGIGQLLGAVHFRYGFRQYVFRAEPNVDMSSGCQKFVSAFLDYQNTLWKSKNKGE